MRNLNRVVWMKGMYLAPQHLQQTDRCSDAMLAFWMRTSPLPAWGFVELSVDQDALANGAFRISMAQGIFPDGTIFSAPDSDPLPPMMSIAERFEPDQENLEVQIALSRNLAEDARTVGDEFTRMFAGSGGRYVTYDANLKDDLAAADERPVVLAARNIRAVPAGGAAASDVTLDCARVIRNEAGIFRLDPGFAPPSLQIRASETLMQVLRLVVELLVSARAAVLRNNIAAADTERLRRDLLLRDLNVAIASLMHVFRSGHEHPEAAYRELLNAAGMLSLASPSFDPSGLARYDHSRPAEAFRSLAETIRQLAAALTA